jgi:hypothetical protein
MRLSIIFVVLITSNFVKNDVIAADFTILGTRIGMNDSIILKSLPPDLKDSAIRDLVGALGEVSVPMVRITAGEDDCGWERKKDYAVPCTTYRAFLLQKGNYFQAASITLDQYFERPIDSAAMEKILIEAYGDPAVQISKPLVGWNPQKSTLEETSKPSLWSDGKPITVPPFTRPLWIWSPELSIVVEKDRAKLLVSNPNPGSVGLSVPLLRAIMNTDDEGLVRGLRLVLHDPIAMGKRDDLEQEAFEIEQSARKKDAASKIRLR